MLSYLLDTLYLLVLQELPAPQLALLVGAAGLPKVLAGDQCVHRLSSAAHKTACLPRLNKTSACSTGQTAENTKAHMPVCRAQALQASHDLRAFPETAHVGLHTTNCTCRANSETERKGVSFRF